jgi:trehalose-6-phosphatase
MSSHNHALYAGELREEIQSLKQEIVERIKYEAFLRSVIHAGEDIFDEYDFEWFRKTLPEEKVICPMCKERPIHKDYSLCIPCFTSNA